MGWNDRQDADDGFADFLREIVDSGRIEGVELGVAKQVIGQGRDSLSDKQRSIFDQVLGANTTKMCSRCESGIPWSEMLESLDNGGMCSYCAHQMQKND